MTVYITLTTAGTDSGPFNLYSDLDGFVTPFEVGVAKVDLESGYTSILVPDFTSVVRVLSTAQYCINYVDITLTEPPCTRPEGLSNKIFYWRYTPDGGVLEDFTSSPLLACSAVADFNTGSGQLGGKTGQLETFAELETVYNGLLTDCTLLPDGFYITDSATEQITEVSGGIIVSIGYCTTTTTTTTL
jgi:hypothetical protein